MSDFVTYQRQSVRIYFLSSFSALCYWSKTTRNQVFGATTARNILQTIISNTQPWVTVNRCQKKITFCDILSKKSNFLRLPCRPGGGSVRSTCTYVRACPGVSGGDSPPADCACSEKAKVLTKIH